MITQEQKEKALKFVEAIKNATQSFQPAKLIWQLFMKLYLLLQMKLKKLKKLQILLFKISFNPFLKHLFLIDAFSINY